MVTVKETVSVTPSYTSTAREVVHEVIKVINHFGTQRLKIHTASRLQPKIQISSSELAKMVEEETQDVENTLKMVPPDLTFQEDRYASKKRLQRLRLTTDSIILLEEVSFHNNLRLVVNQPLFHSLWQFRYQQQMRR